MRSLFRRLRLRVKSFFGRDVFLPVALRVPVEHHGSDRCGWPVLVGSLHKDSIVYSFGIGEDASFDLSVIEKYGCRVLAFDPTPKSIEYVKKIVADPRFVLHAIALADHVGTLELFLPTDDSHVSASLKVTNRTKGQSFLAECATLSEIVRRHGHEKIDVLKIDIEGAEYSALGTAEGLAVLMRTHQLLIEFHHWMHPFGVKDTREFCSKMHRLGFEVAWTSALGHEVLFVNRNWS
jgi:FkbM family methyltransferase